MGIAKLNFQQKKHTKLYTIMVLILVSLPQLFKFYTIDFLHLLTYGFIYHNIEQH